MFAAALLMQAAAPGTASDPGPKIRSFDLAALDADPELGAEQMVEEMRDRVSSLCPAPDPKITGHVGIVVCGRRLRTDYRIPVPPPPPDTPPSERLVDRSGCGVTQGTRNCFVGVAVVRAPLGGGAMQILPDRPREEDAPGSDD